MGTSSSYNMKNAICLLALTLALASAQTCDIKTGIACAKDIEPCIATCKTGLAACAKCLAGSWSGCCPCVKKAIPKLPLTCPSVDQVSTSTTALAVTWTDCAPAGADAKITTLTPDTIVLGATTKFTGGGVLKKDLTGGTYTMTMTGIGGVSLLSCQGDASVAATCPIGLGPIKVGTAQYGAVKFPVKAGDAVSLPDIVSVALPVGLPAFATKTITTLTVKDSAGTEAFCAQITTTPKDTDAVSPIVASEDSWVHV